MGRNKKMSREDDVKWRQYARDSFNEAVDICDNTVKQVLLFTTGPDFIASIAQLKDAKLIDDSVKAAVDTSAKRVDLITKLAEDMGLRAGIELTDMLFILSHFDLLFRPAFVDAFSKKREGLTRRPTGRLSRAIYALEADLDRDGEP